MKHPHPDRVAEVYRRNPEWPQPGKGPAFIWIGYVADPPAGAMWDEEILGWILNEKQEES